MLTLRNTRFILGAAMLLLGASLHSDRPKDGKGRQGGAPRADELLRHQRGRGKRRRSGRPGWSRHALPDARGGGRTRQQHLARLSQHAGCGRGQCARSHRERSVGQRQGPADRGQRRRAAWRHAGASAPRQPHHQVLGAQRKRRDGKGFGDTPNEHDILTGSQPDGRAYTDAADHTCSNWTSSGMGTAQLGHLDRMGGPNASWNSVHPSQGCSQQNLVATGGAGMLYCFAIN